MDWKRNIFTIWKTAKSQLSMTFTHTDKIPLITFVDTEPWFELLTERLKRLILKEEMRRTRNAKGDVVN